MGLRNWAGNVQFAGRVHRPSSVDELRKVVARSERLRPLGTAHSFNRIADTDGELVSVTGLPPVVTIDGGTATVSAGIRYGDVVAELDAAGYALPSLASLPHISVAGAVATATHGSGHGIGNLATAVTALELVTADGELVTVWPPGAVVGLGALGVVTAVTLELVPAFEIRQYVYDDLPMETLAEQFDEVFGSAYSVSVFTSWDGRCQVWRKQLREGAPARWLGARLADGPRHPIATMDPKFCTEQQGVPGPWYARLPHFRLEFTPSAGDELQSEYFVPRDRAVDALAALERIRHLVAPVLQISEIRVIAADELWLSPCYQRDSVAFHFTWIADADKVTPVIAAVERQLALLSPRPHWGKLFGLDPQYPRWPDFAALARELDPAGKLRNDFLNRFM